MSTPSSPRRQHIEINHDRVLDDELEVVPGNGDLPDHLDLPIDTPEPDAIAQQRDEPLPDDDEYR